MATYRRTHPWLTFALNTEKAPGRLWLALGEARSKCDHLAGIPLKPNIAMKLHEVYLAKGVHATAAIEGNTLNQQQVLERIEGKGQLPQSQEYLGKEIDNILDAANGIMDRVSKRGFTPITVDDIENYNATILRGLELEEYVEPGKTRKIDVGVMDYKAPAAAESDELLRRLCEWLNSTDFKPPNEDDSIVSGIIKAIVAHIYIAWIHPFGDGNGRTARLLEVRFLMEAGVPSAAVHLLSNHYNITRSDYYRRLSEASKNGGDLNNFFQYAVRGFVDQLRQQLRVVKYQQWELAWESYVYEKFGEKRTSTTRRQLALILALSEKNKPVARSELRRINPKVAELYAGKTSKTLSRDLNALRKRKLISVLPEGIRPNKEIILAFLPDARAGGLEAQLKESAALIDEAGQLIFGF
ncbi:MAG: Fic family protein [Rhizobiales bacterium]|nr:Fic family protein [Hyphomicrobiales bacterium]